VARLHRDGEGWRTGLEREQGLHVVRRLLQVAGGGVGSGSSGSALLLVGSGPSHLTYHIGTISLDGFYSN